MDEIGNWILVGVLSPFCKMVKIEKRKEWMRKEYRESACEKKNGRREYTNRCEKIFQVLKASLNQHQCYFKCFFFHYWNGKCACTQQLHGTSSDRFENFSHILIERNLLTENSEFLFQSVNEYCWKNLEKNSNTHQSHEGNIGMKKPFSNASWNRNILIRN